VPNPCRPWWLPHLLAAGVVLPIAAGIGLLLHSMYTDEGWGTPRSGFAWLGVSMFTPVLVLVAALAWRAAARRDGEAYQAAAAFFALVAGLLTISLADAAAVALELREGKVPLNGLAFVIGGWTYSVLMALGHWHLYRVFRPSNEEVNGERAPGTAGASSCTNTSEDHAS
jgi:hypothetical protein